MMSLYDSSLILRTAFGVTVLLCMILTCSIIIFAFLRRRKLSLVVNAISFMLDFFVLLALSETAKSKSGIYVNLIFLNILHKPVHIFILLTVVSASISIFTMIRSRPLRSQNIASSENYGNDYLLCKRAEQLQKDNIRLTEMNKQMKLYSEKMQEQIRQREILQAKMRIHNGMNRLLMISSRAVESGDESEIEKAMSLWHNDALLLCMESENEENANVMQDIKALAESLHIRLSCNNIPENFDEKTAILFEKTACEAMLNAVKHANADSFEITVTENGFSFSNNGELSNDRIHYGGGLNAIKLLAEDAGYEMTVQCDDCFRLDLAKNYKKEVG